MLAVWMVLGALTARADDIVVFGDSLSDIGNLATLQGPLPSPHHLGSRGSDGPVAVEVFARLAGESLSYSLNVTEPCFDPESAQYTVDCNGGDSVGQFVFFDWIHPTARTHAIAGGVMYAYAPVTD